MNNLFRKIRNTSRLKKQLIFSTIDIFLIISCLIGSFSIRLGYFYWPADLISLLIFLYPVIAIPLFYSLGLYNTVLRFIGLNTIWELIKTVSFVALVWSLIVILSGVKGIPRSVTLINWLLLLFSIIGIRLLSYWILYNYFPIEKMRRKSEKMNICIYGAGKAGDLLASSLSNTSNLEVTCFIDDDKSLINKSINGIKVYERGKIEWLIHNKKISEIVFAIPSISRSKRNNIINELVKFNIPIKTIPDLNSIFFGKVEINEIKDISIEDLLKRDEIMPDVNLMSKNIKNKNVLITGAGGSIGFELCKEISIYAPKKILLFELNEYSLFNAERYLKEKFDNIQIFPILGNITNFDHINIICEEYKIDTIFHAAAYKHVPLLQKNIVEGVYNNIIGTLNCINVCIKNNIGALVLVSTDKAVRPKNIMGASKRFSEMLMQSINLEDIENSTKFVSVRFGNVLGSSGSVVPTFREQIKKGGPLTITHPDIVRYFMTQKEAAQLVIQASAIGSGGEIFLLDMGEPVKIIELAKKMISLSGLEIKDDTNPYGDIQIVTTGLRSGEKLFEELLIDGKSSSTIHQRIFKADEGTLDWMTLNSKILLIEKAKKNYDVELIVKTLSEAVPELSTEEIRVN